jgi:superfamily I DNA/RNA helicase
MVAQMDPRAVSPAEELSGDQGTIDVVAFRSDYEEAEAVAALIDQWLREGTEPSEIAILVRQQPHLVAAILGRELARLGIPFRNEQESQDLTAEPAVALVLDFIRVVASSRDPEAYIQLMRVSNRTSLSDDEASRLNGQLTRMISRTQALVRDPNFKAHELASWRTLVYDFLKLVSRSTVTALSADYRQGTRLNDLIKQALDAFGQELAIDGDPIQACRRLSELDAIRFLTIHKCKGLEFEKVVVLGVEEQLFWDPTEAISEFFVAISRAKQHLVLTHVQHRNRPEGFHKRWDQRRTPHRQFLQFACEE